MKKPGVMLLAATGIAMIAPNNAGHAQNEKPVIWTSEFRLMNLVSDSGQIQTEFPTQRSAEVATQGNSYNQSLKNGWEIVVMQPKPCPAMASLTPQFATYALYGGTSSKTGQSIEKLLFEAERKVIELRSANKDTAQIDAVFDETRQMLKTIPALTANVSKVDKDGRPIVPFFLTMPPFFGNSFLKLEVEDSGAPQIGPRINDAHIYQATNPCGGAASPDALRKTFGDMGVPNGFTDLKAALTAAALLDQPYLKLIVEQGGKLWIYRVGKSINTNISDPNEYLAQFNDLKLNPGYRLRIVAIGRGKEMQTAGQ
jgi:hypothetical protein